MDLDTLLTWFNEPSFWHWFTAAVVLIIFELILPTTFLVWTGIGAFCTGILVYLNPELDGSIQIVLFAILSLVSIVLGRKWITKRPIESDEPLLNRRGEQYLGRVVTLEEPLRNGVAHVSIDDTRWRIEGPDLPAGGQVRITAINGSSLLVEHLQS